MGFDQMGGSGESGKGCCRMNSPEYYAFDDSGVNTFPPRYLFGSELRSRQRMARGTNSHQWICHKMRQHGLPS
jgi:hypothetical protein